MEDDDLEAHTVSSSLLLDDRAFKGAHSNLTSPARSGAAAASINGSGFARPLYELEENSLHASISAHLSGDWSHPKRLAFLVQYAGGLLLLIYALAVPFFARLHFHSPSHPPHDGEGDSGFGRNWFAFLLLFQGVHQLALGYASNQSLSVLQSHEIEYYEHNFAGVLAWLMGGLSHVARVCLIFDVSAAHGQSIGGGAIFLMLSSAMIILTYFFYAYRKSLSATVAAISAAAMSVFLSAALFHASSLNHVAPGSAIGAAVGLWLYALLVYPMLCMRQLQPYVWMCEVANIVVWTWLLVCYSAFDNCVG